MPPPKASVEGHTDEVTCQQGHCPHRGRDVQQGVLESRERAMDAIVPICEIRLKT